MRLTTAIRASRPRARLALLGGVAVLTVGAVAAASAPVLGSDATHPGPGHRAPVRSSTGVLDDRVPASPTWHAARTDATGTAAGRGTDAVRAAISPSPHLSRAQVDAMSPREIVQATLGDVVRQAGRAHGADAARLGRAQAKRKLSFLLTTFNALGSQHTAPFGDAVAYAPGRIRTQWMTDYLNSVGSSVVGMQEIQADQVENLNLTTGGQFSFWPGAALGGAGVPQTMMWKTAQWKPKALDYIVVPFMGGTRPQPVVLLKNKATRQKLYVVNIHNSPKDRKGRQKERNKAVAIEKTAVRKLRKTGFPVFIVGDFNEHKTAFCKMTSRTGLKAANGGSHPRKGGCRPPKNMRVDWIFGSQSARLTGFRQDQGPLIQRITDHAVLTTKVTVR